MTPTPTGTYYITELLKQPNPNGLYGPFAFGLSGYVVSSAAFLNATTTLAWMPWLLAAAVAARDAVGGSRLLAGGASAAATALLLLGGEPALGAIALTLAVVFAASGPRATRFHALGTYSRDLTPQQTEEFIRSEEKLWHPVVRALNEKKS